MKGTRVHVHVTFEINGNKNLPKSFYGGWKLKVKDQNLW